MDQVLFERLLEDATLFEPKGGHRAIEIHISSASDPQIRETVLLERQLAPWCREPKFDGGGSLFRLLICSARVLDRDIWPLPVSSSTLNSMLGALEIPPIFPRAICRHIPLATSFESLETGDRHGILLRTNLSHTWQYALALVHDPSSRTTTGVILGLRTNEIEEIAQSVKYAARYMSCPSVLPCILMDKALDALVKDAEERRKNLTQIRIETGSHGFRRASLLSHLNDDTWDDRDDLDLDVLMQKLTSLSDACAGITAVCKMQSNFIGVISSFQTRLTAIVAGDKASRLARQQLRFFEQFLLGVESKVSYTKSSVQDQVQTIYTLINQKDSRNHMVLARTTSRLAELSRKDSTDMRVISAVTLVFLPATFTSTLFSASFFNFQPNESYHVSTWIWLYWVVTALLTVIVLGFWWYFSRQQHVKAEASYRKQSEMKQAGLEKYEARLEETAQPMGRLKDFRPYLGGSIAEGMFARKLSLPLDSPGPRRADTGNISPTATSPR